MDDFEETVGETSDAFEEPTYTSYPYNPYADDTYLRSEALRQAVAVVTSVNRTTAWVPIDTALLDMFYNFLKGDSMPDPTATDG